MWNAKKLYYRNNDNYFKAYKGGDIVWLKPDDNELLTFVFTTPGGVSMTNNSGNTPNIEYSKNNGAWTVWDYTNINMSLNDYIKFRGTNTQFNSKYSYSYFVITGTCYASGNIMTLLNYQNPGVSLSGKNYCFHSLFEGCTTLVSAPELPATTLADYCYIHMFAGCSSLTIAPALPATTILQFCYNNMFRNCTSLVNTPELPATTAKANCYLRMFENCTSLTAAPELPATTLAELCYSYMFNGCTSLTAAPELPATNIENWCYTYMFNGCSSLTQVKCLATPYVRYTTSGWLTNVSESGTFIKKSGTNWPSGIDGIPTGWTVIEV